jgi:hypothetical protein
MNSDSVNLGSNPSSPATQNVEVSGKIAPGHPGHPGQTAHIGRTEVGTALLLALFEDHYWDSLTPHREIVLAHVSSVLGMVCPVMSAPALVSATVVDRPNWNEVMKGCGGCRTDDNALVSVTKGTLRIAASALREQNGRDYYHNYGAAETEALAVLRAGAADHFKGEGQ